MPKPIEEAPKDSSLSWRLPLIILALITTVLVGIWWYLRARPAGQVVSGITGNPRDILKSQDNRTGVVFLGIGGKGHEGADLTDSMIAFSYDHDSGRVALIPIPRDIWVVSMQAKINTAYHYGQLDLVKKSVTEIIGQPIHYAVVLDFEGFEKVIDAVGGIDLVVDNSFEDLKYPIAGKETAQPESDRYEHLSFTAGDTHMDGSTALKFARSRYAEGDEGTDFARSKRQEKVIVAFKNKLLSSSTLLSVSTLQNLLAQVKDSVDTDISDEESGAFIRLFLDFAGNNNASTSISLVDLFTTPKNLSPYQGQWVLIPKTSIEDVYAYVAQKISAQ